MAKPRVIHLNLDSDGPENQIEDFFDAIRAKATLERIDNLQDATALFTSTARPPIFTDDHKFHYPANGLLRAHVVQYVRSGGTIIGIGSFGSYEVGATPIFELLGLPWKGCEYTRYDFILNPAFEHFGIDKLPSPGIIKGSHIMDVDLKDRVYVLEPNSNYNETAGYQEMVAVAFAKVGAGRFGYISDIKYTDGTLQALLAMLGLLD